MNGWAEQGEEEREKRKERKQGGNRKEALLPFADMQEQKSVGLYFHAGGDEACWTTDVDRSVNLRKTKGIAMEQERALRRAQLRPEIWNLLGFLRPLLGFDQFQRSKSPTEEMSFRCMLSVRELSIISLTLSAPCCCSEIDSSILSSSSTSWSCSGPRCFRPLHTTFSLVALLNSLFRFCDAHARMNEREGMGNVVWKCEVPDRPWEPEQEEIERTEHTKGNQKETEKNESLPWMERKIRATREARRALAWWAHNKVGQTNNSTCNLVCRFSSFRSKHSCDRRTVQTSVAGYHWGSHVASRLTDHEHRQLAVRGLYATCQTTEAACEPRVPEENCRDRRSFWESISRCGLAERRTATTLFLMIGLLESNIVDSRILTIYPFMHTHTLISALRSASMVSGTPSCNLSSIAVAPSKMNPCSNSSKSCSLYPSMVSMSPLINSTSWSFLSQA